jgi:hypothetical protein
MTAPHRPDPDDLASALVDGLLDADEAAAARRDPAVVARVAALAAARDAVAAPPPAPDPAERERAIAAALSAFDAETSADDEGAIAADAVREEPASPMPGRFDHATPLPRQASRPPAARRRGPRSARSERWARWLGAAAAVVLVVAGVSLLARSNDSDDGDSAATSAESSSEDTGAGSEAEESGEAGDDAARDEAEESAGGDSAGALEAGEVLDLGAADSPEALADRARSTLDAERELADQPASDPNAGAVPDTTDSTPGDGDEDGVAAQASEPLACPTGDATATARGGTVDLRARALLDGEPVEVWLVDVGGSLTLLAVDADCAVVVDSPLPG